MRALAIIKTVFPSPRRPVRRRDLIYPIAFMATFAAAVLCLMAARIVSFSSPWAFCLAAAMPWIWWMHFAGGGGLGGVRSWISLTLRLCIVGAFIMLIAEPRAVRTNKDLAVIYALDVSDSVAGPATHSAMKFVAETVHAKPQKDQVGLVVFAGNAAVELPPRVTFAEFDAVNSQVRRDATNLEKGLSLALAVLPEDRDGRIVLISDGAKTEGEQSPVLDRIVARGVPVDVLPIQYQYKEEVWLEKLELPRRVKVGETYEAAVLLSSLEPGTGRLSLSENGQVIFDQVVDYPAGKTRYALPLSMRAPGFYEYVALIQPLPGHDGRPENNIAVASLYLEGEGKVLVVTDPDGEPRDWEPFLAALQEGKFKVERMSPLKFPQSVMPLMPYDSIVFLNVGAELFDEAQMQAAKSAVHDLGAGFLMIGGKNSYGPGGYNRTAIEETLPVTMDVSQKKVLPKGALVIILHTCEFADGNTWGKRIAKQAIKVLSAKDEVGILAYGPGGENWVFPLTPAEKYEELVVKINEAQLGDMPSFGTTMRMGLDALKQSDAAAKHMIIISDGDPTPPVPSLLQEFRENGVSVSTVAIFPHGGVESATLELIARATAGRYYFPQDPEVLPSIFIKEAKTIRRSMFQSRIFTPELMADSPIMKGITELMPLTGYVVTSLKPRSQMILRAPPEGDEADPILATWRYGVGKAAAWTSDLCGNWAKAWIGWEKYNPFVKQLMTDISRSRERSDLAAQGYSDGTTGMIEVEDYRPDADFLQMEAWVRGPDDKREKVGVRQVGPGRYEAQFPLWGRGRYEVSILGAGRGRTEQTLCGFAVPYSPEYRRFYSDTPALLEIAERTGGRVLTGDEKSIDIFPPKRNERRTSSPIMDWFLIALAIAFPLDVAVRRVQLDKDVILGWFRPKRRGKSAETLDRLLQRKREVDVSIEEARPRIPRIQRSPRTPPPPPAGQKPEPTQPKGPKPDEGITTTGRLLAAKKKWNKEDRKDG